MYEVPYNILRLINRYNCMIDRVHISYLIQWPD